jgi:hypothetical protein
MLYKTLYVFSVFKFSTKNKFIFFKSFISLIGLIFSLGVNAFNDENKFFPTPVTTGSTSIVLQPIESVQLNSSEVISFGMPFPKGYISNTSTIRLLDINGNEIPIFTKALTPWRNLLTGEDEESLRSILIQLEVNYTDDDGDGLADSLPITVEWGEVSKTTHDLLEVNTANTWRLVDSHLYSAEEGVYEPPVYAIFSASWYGLSVLKSRLLPSGTHPDFAMYDEAFNQFSQSALNKVDPRVSEEYLTDYSTAYAAWLYDRSMTLYQAAFKTGDYQLLREAHRASHFYANHIDSNGYFDLKPTNDLKYSYVEGLATNYWLTGSDTMKAKIRQMESVFDSFNVEYSLSHNFWTERHAAITLTGYVVAFEVFGGDDLAEKSQEAFTALYNMQNFPSSGIPNTGGLMHTSYSHGEGGDYLVSSPWMSALLADAVERYYIHSNDNRVKLFITRLANYLGENGLYSSNEIYRGALPDIRIPYYITGEELTDYQRNFSPWGNIEHSLDVSKVFALAYFLNKDDQNESLEHMKNFGDLYKTAMEFTLPYWIRDTAPSLELGTLLGGKPVFRLTPPRKYSWWFKSTSNLDWLIGEGTRVTSSQDMHRENDTTPIIDVKITSNIQNAYEGDIIEFNVEYKNIGTETAANVILLNEVHTNSDYFEIVPGSISNGGVYHRNRIYWNVGQVGINDVTQSLSFKVLVTKPNTLFSSGRPSPSIIAQTSARYGKPNDPNVKPSPNMWNLGTYTHSRISNMESVKTLGFVESLPPLSFENFINMDGNNIENFSLNIGNVTTFTVLHSVINGKIEGTFPNFTYQPNSGFIGTDSFEFIYATAYEEKRGRVFFEVTAVNNAPEILNNLIETISNKTITQLIEAIDIDDDNLVFDISEEALNGKVTIENNMIVYQPDTNFLGHDEFILRAFDGYVYSQALISIEVKAKQSLSEFIDSSIEVGDLKPWIGSYIIGRLNSFYEQVEIIDDLETNENISGIDLLLVKHKANMYLLYTYNYLQFVINKDVIEVINSKINTMMYDTLSSSNSEVIDFRNYILTQSQKTIVHPYFLYKVEEYLVRFDYYLSQINEEPDAYKNAEINVTEALRFIQFYIYSAPEDEFFQEVYNKFDVQLRMQL